MKCGKHFVKEDSSKHGHIMKYGKPSDDNPPLNASFGWRKKHFLKIEKCCDCFGTNEISEN